VGAGEGGNGGVRSLALAFGRCVCVLFPLACDHSSSRVDQCRSQAWRPGESSDGAVDQCNIYQFLGCAMRDGEVLSGELGYQLVNSPNTEQREEDFDC